MKNVINIGKVCGVASENGKPISVLELCDMFYHNIHNMLGLALSKALLGDKVAKKAYDAGVEQSVTFMRRRETDPQHLLKRR